jgi:hypothetical protein
MRFRRDEHKLKEKKEYMKSWKTKLGRIELE